jgi:hypothetical protein
MLLVEQAVHSAPSGLIFAMQVVSLCCLDMSTWVGGWRSRQKAWARVAMEEHRWWKERYWDLQVVVARKHLLG